MSADVSIRRWTGAAGSPVKTDVAGTNQRHRTDDTLADSGSAASLAIPEGGLKTFSYWQSLLAYTPVDEYDVGESMHPAGVVTVAQAATSYVRATGTAGENGDELTEAAHAGLVDAPVDIATVGESSPLVLGGTVSAPGDVGNFLVMQVQIESTAPAGPLPATALTFQWDEV